MSERIDLLTYLKTKLNNEHVTNLDSPTAQTIHRLVSTADSIQDEHFNQLAPELPHSPKLMLAVRALNGAIVAGMSSPANFYEYLTLLAIALRA